MTRPTVIPIPNPKNPNIVLKKPISNHLETNQSNPDHDFSSLWSSKSFSQKQHFYPWKRITRKWNNNNFKVQRKLRTTRLLVSGCGPHWMERERETVNRCSNMGVTGEERKASCSWIKKILMSGCNNNETSEKKK